MCTGEERRWWRRRFGSIDMMMSRAQELDIGNPPGGARRMEERPSASTGLCEPGAPRWSGIADESGSATPSCREWQDRSN